MADSKNGGNGRGEKLDDVAGDEPTAAGHAGFVFLGEFLESDGWHPQVLEERHVYRMQCRGRNATFSCYAQVRIEFEQILFYAVCPVRVAEERRATVAEFLTRANYGMRIGNFEMDYEDGEVRYKSGLDFEGAELSAALLRGIVYPAVQTLDAYLPGLLAVSHGDKTPTEAILEIEDEGED